MSTSTSSKTDSDIKIACRHIWKVFGPDATGFLSRHGVALDGQSKHTIDFGDSDHIGAVQDLSFDVHQGEILVIMGLSGSGKSTLIRCISRLLEPTAGQVLFDGRDLAHASEAELIEIRRHEMGMVFQNFGLLPHRSVLANIAFPLEVQGVARSTREQRAAEIVELVGLKGREHYFPRELSGGQQQRVGIGRSLAVEPDVWFLDEPFSALDPLIRREMQDEFLRLQRMLHKTIIFITHDFEEAVRVADRIGIMKDGRLIQLSTPEYMVNHPADDYVAEFTKNAPRDKILTVGSVMQTGVDAGASNGSGGISINVNDKLGDIAAVTLSRDAPIAVVDDRGERVGVLERQDLIAALFDDTRRETHSD